MSVISNCHTHVFTNRNVPDGFLPLKLLVLFRKKPVARFLTSALKRILPFTENDVLDRLAVFLGIGGMGSQEEIFLHIKSFYPEGTRIVALSMDMDNMGAGGAPQDFLNQLAELRELKEEYPDLLIPFIAADPRRDDLLDLVMDHMDNHGFGGIKLYPPLGYFPFDERFGKLFDIAQERQIPIIAHCSRSGIYTRRSITEEMRIHPKTGEVLKGCSSASFAHNYTDPSNYKWLLEEFPRLKICLAHFGGEIEWRKYLNDPWPSKSTEKSWLATIAGLIQNHENVYADVAYTVHDCTLLPLLKVLINTPGLREKILYGSDAYMVQLEGSEREFSINVRGYLGETDFRQISEINPQRFLAFERSLACTY